MDVIDFKVLQHKIETGQVSATPPMAATGEHSPSKQYDAEERERVDKFYTLIRTAWGDGKFRQQFIDADDLRRSKRYWAPEILQHSLDDLARAVEVSRQRRMQGNPRYDWPDIAVILGVIGEQPTDTERQQQRYAAGVTGLLDFSPPREFRLEQIRKLRQEHGL